MKYGASQPAERIFRPLLQMFSNGSSGRSSDNLHVIQKRNKQTHDKKRLNFISQLPVSAPLPPSPLHHRPRYGVLWRLAKTPPLKMKEQLVSEGITLCILWHSARAIISHQFSAYRWTRRIWSCKHCWGKQKEHGRRTGRGFQFGGTVPICAECLFKSLHKGWIDVHANVWLCFFFLRCC